MGYLVSLSLRCREGQIRFCRQWSKSTTAFRGPNSHSTCSFVSSLEPTNCILDLLFTFTSAIFVVVLVCHHLCYLLYWHACNGVGLLLCECCCFLFVCCYMDMCPLIIGIVVNTSLSSHVLSVGDRGPRPWLTQSLLLIEFHHCQFGEPM